MKNAYKLYGGVNWKHIAWREIALPDSPETQELFDIVAKQCYALIDVELNYEAYYQQFKQIIIPTVSKISDTSDYVSLMDNYETDGVVSVELFLDSLLEQLKRSSPRTTAEETPEPESKNLFVHLNNYFERALAHFSHDDISTNELAKDESLMEISRLDRIPFI